MKSLSILAIVATASFALSANAQDTKKRMDAAFEEGMRSAFADYKKGDTEAVTAKLRELVKLLEESGAEKVGELLPETIEFWKGGLLKRDDIGALGGGISLSRSYTASDREVTVKVVKDSPMAKQIIPLLANEDLVRLSGRKTQRINGQTAIMDGEKKLQMVLDGRILVEVSGNDAATEKDVLMITKALDLKALEKLK
jgi:hypothetical protein